MICLILTIRYRYIPDSESFVDTTNYQYELCEKPIFKLPPAYKQKGIVIMDGPFMCFDPFANTEYHVAGNVQHAIHASNTGKSLFQMNISMFLIVALHISHLLNINSSSIAHVLTFLTLIRACTLDLCSHLELFCPTWMQLIVVLH